MKKENRKHFGLRVDGETVEKFQYACLHLGHSPNSQMIQLMLEFIWDCEKEHDKIELPDSEKNEVHPMAGLFGMTIFSLGYEVRLSLSH